MRDERDDLGHCPDGRYPIYNRDGWTTQYRRMPPRTEHTRRRSPGTPGSLWNNKTGRITASRPKVERRRDHRYYPWSVFDRLAIDALELDNTGFDSSRSKIGQEKP